MLTPDKSKKSGKTLSAIRATHHAHARNLDHASFAEDFVTSIAQEGADEADVLLASGALVLGLVPAVSARLHGLGPRDFTRG
jgi:light-regulated signal transduction histidine kinase (bacteriophytochrome)